MSKKKIFLFEIIIPLMVLIATTCALVTLKKIGIFIALRTGAEIMALFYFIFNILTFKKMNGEGKSNKPKKIKKSKKNKKVVEEEFEDEEDEE